MKRFILITGIILFSFTVAFAQEDFQSSHKKEKEAKKAEMKKKVEKLLKSKDYTFIARQANPMGGGSINLTSEYDLKVKGDTVVAFLPFYGVAYKAELPNEGGIKFEENTNNYMQIEKKGSYEIAIKVKTTKDNYRLYLVVSPSGYASLNVTSDNRQPISFNGILDGLGL